MDTSKTTAVYILIFCLVAAGTGFCSAETPDRNALTEMIKKQAAWNRLPPEKQSETEKPVFNRTPLSRAQEKQVRKELWHAWTEYVKKSKYPKYTEYGNALTTGKGAVRTQIPTASGETVHIGMRYFARTFGKKPAGGWPLYINFHSGGDSKKLNDRCWALTAKQYPVRQGLYVCPRSVKDTAESWYEPENYPLLRKLLAEAYAVWGVNPNKVYIMGYSMGGWGTLHLAPSIPDYWAAAAASAGAGFTGATGRSSPLNLRNTPVMIQVGEKDTMFRRQPLSRAFADRLKELHKKDPGGYIVRYREHKGKGHAINDRNTPQWLSRFTRNPVPDKIVWQQLIPIPGTSIEEYNKVMASKPLNFEYLPKRHFWLRNSSPGPFQLAVVSRKGNTIRLEKTEYLTSITILLDDRMVDLEQPVTVLHGSKTVFSKQVDRTVHSLVSTLAERGDPELVFCSELTVSFDCPVAALEEKPISTPDLLVKRARYRTAHSRYSDAVSDLRAALKLTPKKKKNDMYRILIRLAHKQNDTAGQLEIYREWIDTAEDSVKLLTSAAAAFLRVKDEKLRDRAYAVRLLERADRITDHKNPSVIRLLAYAEYVSGNAERAVKLQKKAISLIPKHWPKQIRRQFTDSLKKYRKAARGK